MSLWFRKNRSSAEVLPDLADWDKVCSDCGANPGQLHRLFCPREKCPFCGGQLKYCACLMTVLDLAEHERIAVTKYVDDGVEPLRSIMKRWYAALSAQGRVPFQPIQLTVEPNSLLLVSGRGALPFVRKLLLEGLSVNTGNEIGFTALMSAARSCQVDLVAFLLGEGADARQRDQYDRTALHCSVALREDSFRQVSCIQILRSARAEVDAQDKLGDTPLSYATWAGAFHSVQALVEANAEVFHRNHEGRTAWDFAREAHHDEIAAYLAQKMTG